MSDSYNPFVVVFKMFEQIWSYFFGALESVLGNGARGLPIFDGQLLIALKILSISFSALFLAGIIWAAAGSGFVAWHAREAREFLLLPPLRRREALKIWERIQKRIKSGQDAELRLALIEVDKLWDDLLVRMGYAGETTAERMKYLSAAQFSNLEDLWAAHKLRNRVVHDMEYHPRHDEILRAIEIYEKAFREMQLIE